MKKDFNKSRQELYQKILFILTDAMTADVSRIAVAAFYVEGKTAPAVMIYMKGTSDSDYHEIKSQEDSRAIKAISGLVDALKKICDDNDYIFTSFGFVVSNKGQSMTYAAKYGQDPIKVLDKLALIKWKSKNLYVTGK